MQDSDDISVQAYFRELTLSSQVYKSHLINRLKLISIVFIILKQKYCKLVFAEKLRNQTSDIENYLNINWCLVPVLVCTRPWAIWVLNPGYKDYHCSRTGGVRFWNSILRVQEIILNVYWLKDRHLGKKLDFRSNSLCKCV